MFPNPKPVKTHPLVFLLIFWGCVLLAPPFTFSGPGQLNLNTATAEQLETLPGIGPDLAQRILDFRAGHGPFKDVEGLLQVKGIGEAKLAKLRDLVTVEKPAPTVRDPVGTLH